jgi:hypothetical protein
MRRLLAAFLLVLIPVQLSFAAAANYCDGGQACVQPHFGHHVCEDEAHSPEKPAGEGYSPHDCGVCHLGHAQAQTAAFTIVPAKVKASHPPGFGAPAPEHLQEPSERPPRAALA